MNCKRKYLSAILSSLCILAIILDSKTALNSVIKGLEQCINSVIPALFPFFIFTSILVQGLVGETVPVLSRILKATGMPSGSSSIFLAGILGGYPVGANCIAQLNRSGCLSDRDSKRLLGFCVNPGPSFIFGICATFFSNPLIPWSLWLIQVLSAYLVGVILPGKSTGSIRQYNKQAISITQALQASVRNMAYVCGWIVMFRVMIGFADRWFLWLLPDVIRCLLIGMLELTNGCLDLGSVFSQELRFILCSAMLSFGGISVWMQVHSIMDQLSTGMYIPGKLLQCAISTILAWMTQYILFGRALTLAESALPAGLIAMLIVSFVPFRSYYKKNVAFP